MSDPVAAPDFLSGTSGEVWGIRATTRALTTDALVDARAWLTGRRQRLRRAARGATRRRVLALGIERENEPNLLARARGELLRSHHHVRFESLTTGDRGKFENLNLLLSRNRPDGYDWILLVDDDVVLPRGFLDEFLFLVERFGLQLAQPAHRAYSHAAWPLTRRRGGDIVRETAYVEIGPVVALSAATFGELLPFPDLRAGWGLDAHWAGVAQAHGWRLGIVDATPIRHRSRRIASFYSREEAVGEAQRFLAQRTYLPAAESQRTLATHRTWT